jgi:hypothetical protein
MDGRRGTDRRHRRFDLVGAVLAGLVVLAVGGGVWACGGSDDRVGERSQDLDAGRFSATVEHPLVPLSSVRLTVFRGSERDPATGETVRIGVESRVLARRERVANVRVAVVDVKDYEDGELVEHTFDYYAQGADGSVWYFGERVDEYEDGELVGHSGQWLAGGGGAKPGLFMPVRPRVGDTFEQERVPGVAEDRSTVVAVGLDVRTPAGGFSGCIATQDIDPLDDVTERKVYCPGVGLVREQSPAGRLELVRYRSR